VPGLKINRKQLTPITEEGLPDTGGNIAVPETDAPKTVILRITF
jgi:hypothetical protein